VAQDNDDNFKFVSWTAIAAALNGAVEVDTTWDPRQVGAPAASASSQGDFNNDGVVDAADYIAWRNNVGLVVTPFTGADGNGDGVVDTADYLVWKARFGLPVTAAIALGT